ncbi:MAG: ferrous iron transporter B [Clostridia bacterium]|nr:ferrous iron transporter B [Clostridia bacterium]
MQSSPISGRIILAGHPNVGKSTLFNLLTGKKVHTGNWSGKTVSVSEGYGVHNKKKYIIEDLPGMASMSEPHAEEISAFEAVASGNFDCLVVVADATNLTRSLSLALRLMELTSRVVLFVNMYDEAVKKGITINSSMLSFMLGIRVVVGTAHKKSSLLPLWDAIENVALGKSTQNVFTPLYNEETENTLASFSYDRKETIRHIYTSPHSFASLKAEMSQKVTELASSIAKVCSVRSKPPSRHKADKILTHPIWGTVFMLTVLFLVLYITIVASNYPSGLLSTFFSSLGVHVSHLFLSLKLPPFIAGILTEGIYKTTTTVISVMLPPMAIFFPLFAILEDSGILPRIAFNLDDTFKKCGSCGKQALTVCMGLGCNCVGVTNSAIIPSEHERLISILTNSLTPCNGRFGAIIACISIFLAPGSPILSAFIMALVLCFSFLTTLLASKCLSSTVLKGERAPFILELPSFRRVNLLKVTISALTDRTPSILLRAIMVSAPMGALIYILNYFNLLLPIASFLNPAGLFLGMDGILLLSFILSFPANEIVFPVALMLYTQSGTMVEYSSYSALYSILSQNGWTWVTAVCFIIFTLMHWPCSTTLLTVQKETGSIKWTIASLILPVLFGIIFSCIFNIIFGLFV